MVSGELGGADVHARRSGVADHYALDDRHALALARQIVGNLGAAGSPRMPLGEVEEPLYPPAELETVVPVDLRRQYDPRSIIARIVDGSDFSEFKALYGETLVTGFAAIQGMKVGILANNGILFSELALKGAHFIELCCQRKIPLLFLQNITGFMVGAAYEAGGIAKDGAKLVTAVSCAAGAENHADRRRLIRRGKLRHVRARLLAALPLHLAERAHLRHGRRTGGSVLATIRRDNIEADGSEWSLEEEEAFKEPVRARYEAEGNPLYATARLWDDGIILPSETRDVLGLALGVCLNAPVGETTFGVWRM